MHYEAIAVAIQNCSSVWLICAMDAHEGAATWVAGLATVGAVLVALLAPFYVNRGEEHRRRKAFFAFIGHAHALVRMYFNSNDAVGPNGTVETKAVQVALQSALQATNDAIALQFLGGELMIGALNMRSSLNFMLLDLERKAGTAPHVTVGGLEDGYAPLRPDIEKWRTQLKAMGADVGSDTLDGNKSNIIRV